MEEIGQFKCPECPFAAMNDDLLESHFKLAHTRKKAKKVTKLKIKASTSEHSEVYPLDFVACEIQPEESNVRIFVFF